jgi:hypothetical protein
MKHCWPRGFAANPLQDCMLAYAKPGLHAGAAAGKM